MKKGGLRSQSWSTVCLMSKKPTQGEHRGEIQLKDSQTDGGTFGQMKEAVNGLEPTGQMLASRSTLGNRY